MTMMNVDNDNDNREFKTWRRERQRQCHKSIDLIGWMKKNNRAARAARFLVQFFDAVCQITTWIFNIWGSKGLAKLGNIVAETMFLVMFPGVAKLGNICFGRKIVSGMQKCFWLDPWQKHFLFPSSKICFRNTFLARLNWETFASATMFPSLARP